MKPKRNWVGTYVDSGRKMIENGILKRNLEACKKSYGVRHGGFKIMHGRMAMQSTCRSVSDTVTTCWNWVGAQVGLTQPNPTCQRSGVAVSRSWNCQKLPKNLPTKDIYIYEEISISL